MSSAKSLAVVDWSRLSVISLINIMNKSGPRTLPWGTPLMTSRIEEYVEFKRTVCLRLVRKALIQQRRLSEMP